MCAILSGTLLVVGDRLIHLTKRTKFLRVWKSRNRAVVRTSGEWILQTKDKQRNTKSWVKYTIENWFGKKIRNDNSFLMAKALSFIS